MWWKPDGLRCADCWRNIQEGVIPALVWENEGVYIRDSDVKFNYRVHPATRRKLEREGFLKGRQLKRPNGDVYYTIYLVKENKAFFKRYPKNPEYKIELSWDREKGGLLLDIIDDDKKQKTKK